MKQKMSVFEDSFVEISLFEIPDWLKDGDFASPLFKEIEHYRIGSDEWFDRMSETIPVKLKPPKNYDVYNIKSFELIIEVSDFFLYKNREGLDMIYPPSIYAYAFTHLGEVLTFLKNKYSHLYFTKKDRSRKNKSARNLSSDDLKILDFYKDISKDKTIFKYRAVFYNYLLQYFPKFKEEIDLLSKEYSFGYEYNGVDLNVYDDLYTDINFSALNFCVYKNQVGTMRCDSSLEFLLYMAIILLNPNKNYMFKTDDDQEIIFENKNLKFIVDIHPSIEFTMNVNDLNIKKSLDEIV